MEIGGHVSGQASGDGLYIAVLKLMHGPADNAVEDENGADFVERAFYSPALGAICPAGFGPAATTTQGREYPAQFFRAGRTNKITDFPTSDACTRKEKIGDFILELFQPCGQNDHSMF
jgi:hypothetical protein